MRSEFDEWFAENYPFESSMKDGGSLWFKENMGKAWDCRQTEVDELQEEFYETETHLKEKIQQKDLKVEELTYLQGMDRDLIRALQGKSNELQKRVDACNGLRKKWGRDADYADLIAQEDFVQNTLQECINDLEQALKGGLTPNLNTDENGECRHFSTTMFADGKAECFHCDAVVNEQREVIGKQSKGLHPFFKKEPK